LVAFTISGNDLALAVRVGTVLVLLPYLRGFRELRPGPAWPEERQRRMGLVLLVSMIMLTGVNVVIASLGYLEVLLLLALVIGPGLIFYNTIRDAASAERRADGYGPDEDRTVSVALFESGDTATGDPPNGHAAQRGHPTPCRASRS
jgi:hypothetical protein